MSFQPVIPLAGNAGWTFLNRTREAQEEAFRSSSFNNRLTGYFRDNIAAVNSAEDLVADRRLLQVALGAFGLNDDINNKFFIRKVLQEGTRNDAAFANRLSDPRYFRLAEAFGFDLSPPNTVFSDFSAKIVDDFLTGQFEVAVGENAPNMRLALGLGRELDDLAARGFSEAASWFTILGTPPLRRVFEEALNLPRGVSGIDIDRQMELFRDKSNTVFGTADPLDFRDADLQESLIRRFLLRAELTGGGTPTTRGSVALSLLQGANPPI